MRLRGVFFLSVSLLHGFVIVILLLLYVAVGFIWVSFLTVVSPFSFEEDYYAAISYAANVIKASY